MGKKREPTIDYSRYGEGIAKLCPWLGFCRPLVMADEVCQRNQWEDCPHLSKYEEYKARAIEEKGMGDGRKSKSTEV